MLAVVVNIAVEGAGHGLLSRAFEASDDYRPVFFTGQYTARRT